MTGSEKRMLKRANKNNKFLIELLNDFFGFLASKPQPSDQEVRSKFIDLDITWKSYCVRNNLTEGTESLFNATVSSEWKKLEAESQKRIARDVSSQNQK